MGILGGRGRSFFLAAALWWVRADETFTSSCENGCSGKGFCDADRRCNCAEGFTGGDCSLRTCPFAPAWADAVEDIVADNVAHSPVECARRGSCNRVMGECECDDGFSGDACGRRDCGNCFGRGVCTTLEWFAARADPGAGVVHKYTGAWDARALRGCACDAGFSGFACGALECPRGDDPLTLGQLDAGQRITCLGTAGSASLSFRGESTTVIPWDATAADVETALLKLRTLSTVSGNEAYIDDAGLLPEPLNRQLSPAVSVAVLGTSTTWCSNPAPELSVRFLQDFGALPLIVPDFRKLGFVSPPNRKGIISVIETVRGTKETDVCANRGLCSPFNGRCQCDQELWASSDGGGKPGTRGDCGHAIDVITACPGESPCSGHGACAETPTFRCACQAGWTGADCSLRTCPTGRAWFARPTALDTAHTALLECAGMGQCDPALGTCSCAVGFAGSACDQLACPAGASGLPCGNRGHCKTMAMLAAAAGFEYGSDPNSPYTWDAHMVRGCHCDAGFSGHSCELRTCPLGDDPITDAFEQIECSGRGLCNREKGTCECFNGFDASDGAGAKGQLRDCGAITPLQGQERFTLE